MRTQPGMSGMPSALIEICFSVQFKRVKGHLESGQIAREQESDDRMCHLIFQQNISFTSFINDDLNFAIQI